MSDTIQYLLVGIIVLGAVIALVRTIVLTMKNRHTALTACTGCKLHDVCNKPEKNSAKKCANKVAQVEK